MSWEYSKKTKELFMNAVTGGKGSHLGEIKDADGIGEDGSIVCGDAMKLFFKVERDNNNPLNDRIIEIKYQTFGCTSAIAASEALCALIEAKRLTPLEALKIKNKDIVDYLGGLPEQKIHCSVMGAEALESAVKDWATKRNVDLSLVCIGDNKSHEEEDEGRVVCHCMSITEPYLRRKIKEMNLMSVEEVQNATKAGGVCGSCKERPGGIRDLLKEIWGDKLNKENDENNNDKINKSKQESKDQECNFQAKIIEVIDSKIRPALKLHGGDLTLVEIKDNLVYCTLHGACSGCSGAHFTLKNTVEKLLREHVDSHIVVIDI